MQESCLSDTLLRSPDELQRYLEQQRAPALAGLGFPPGCVMPCHGINIANVPATIAESLGAKLLGAAGPLPDVMWRDLATGVQRVVCLILDAVGWCAFRDLLAEEPDLSLAQLARKGRLLPITASVPSTTTSALITLWTGYEPARHGLVAHMMYLRRLGLVGDMLMFSPAGSTRREELLERGLDLETFLPVPGVAQTLAGQGVVTRALINADLSRTAFSRLSFRGVSEVVRFITAADMWVRAHEVLSTRRRERLFLATYLAEPDSIGHLHGPGSDSWRAEMRALAASFEREFLARLSTRERQGTLFLLTADHGQLEGEGVAVPLPDHPGLADHLMLPACGSLRAAYLYACQGQVDTAQAYLRDQLGEQFAVVRSRDALAAGLLGSGQPAPETACRVGDLMAFSRDRYFLDYRKRTYPPLGLHAGLSPDEMLVPFLVARLD